MPRDWLGERLRNDLFCVEWDVKAYLDQSTDISVRLCQGYCGNVTTSELFLSLSNYLRHFWCGSVFTAVCMFVR